MIEVTKTNSPEDDFVVLAKRYNSATQLHSFRHMMVKTEEFGELTAMGQVIVPFILKRFNSGELNGIHWFIVLETITKVVPLEPTSIPGTGFVGIDVNKTKQAWIEWGRKTGHLS